MTFEVFGLRKAAVAKIARKWLFRFWQMGALVLAPLACTIKGLEATVEFTEISSNKLR